jgi:uncharacterized protein (DUF2384 family)
MKHILKANDEYINDWLLQPLPIFDNKSPTQMVEEGRGAEVINAITSILPNLRPNVIKKH